MPLFMVISGFFAGTVFKYSIKEALLTKACQLLIPVLVWGTILYGIETLIIGKDIGTYQDALISRYFWFLKSLFGCFFLFIIGANLIGNRYIGLLIALAISQLFIIYKIRYMFPCFIFGYVLNQNLLFVQKNIRTIVIVSILIFIMMLPGWGVDKMFPSLSKEQLISNPIYSLGFLYYKLIIGLAGSMICIGVCLILCKDKKREGVIATISEWGTYTLSIYILQSVLLETILASLINIDVTNDWRLNFICFPLISFFLLWTCISIHKFMIRKPLTGFMLQPSWKSIKKILQTKTSET